MVTRRCVATFSLCVVFECESCVKLYCIYFGCVGGCASLLSQCCISHAHVPAPQQSGVEGGGDGAFPLMATPVVTRKELPADTFNTPQPNRKMDPHSVRLHLIVILSLFSLSFFLDS